MLLSQLTTKTRRHEGSAKEANFFFVIFLCLRFFLVVLGFGGLSAQAQTPTEIVERAVNAHGGVAALSRLKSFEQIAKGKCSLVGPEMDAVREAKWALPDRSLITLEMNVQGRKLTTVIGLNGLYGWVKANADPAQDLKPGQYDLIADESWVHWLCTVAPLTQKGVKLSPVAPIQVDSVAADGIRAIKEGRPDVSLYFSKSNGLLVKAVARIKDGGATANKEWVFSGHKEYSGVRLPGKIIETQNRQRQAEWSQVEYKFVEKFDAAIFRKP
jgi:hypothetical protein